MPYQSISKEIAILPPFKEKFSPDDFGYVSLYVKDINENSKFKNKIKVYVNITSKTFKGFKSFTNSFISPNVLSYSSNL